MNSSAKPRRHEASLKPCPWRSRNSAGPASVSARARLPFAERRTSQSPGCPAGICSSHKPLWFLRCRFPGEINRTAGSKSPWFHPQGTPIISSCTASRTSTHKSEVSCMPRGKLPPSPRKEKPPIDGSQASISSSGLPCQNLAARRLHDRHQPAEDIAPWPST
jgi:hypothetical protein